MDFFAVPLSSYGRLHSESHRFIERIALKCVNQFRRNQFKKDMRSAIQQALLKGTSDVIDAAVSRLSGRFADWVESSSVLVSKPPQPLLFLYAAAFRNVF